MLEFREQGFLPEALCNYLLRLGWAHGDEEVIFARGGDPAVRPRRRRPRAGRMDYAKLTHLNGVWLRAADDERLTAEVLARLAQRPDLALGAGRGRASGR